MKEPEESLVFRTIKDRRSVRAFEDKSVDERVILAMLEAARWAPSGGNKQPLVYIAVRKPELIERVKAVSPGLIGEPGALIVICIDKRVARSAEMSEHQIDVQKLEVGMAAQNIMLLAHDLGLGTCAILSFHAGAVSRLLAIPDYVLPELIVTLGYPAAVPKVPPRRPLEEILHWDRYGEERHDG